MKHGPTTRWRLQRRRMRRRLKPAIGLSILLGTVFALTEWTGYGVRFRQTGIPNPQPFGEFWRHLFVFGAFVFVSLMLWPFRWWSTSGSLDEPS